MIFLKKCLIYLRLLWYGLFQGFKSVDDLITKNQKDSEDFSIEINNVGNSVYKDILEEKQTQEVKELVYKSYRVAEESKNYRYVGDIGNGYVVKKEKDLSQYPKNIENYDNDKIVLVQDNFLIVKGVNDVLNESNELTYKMKVKRDLLPRFLIERYVTKIVIKENENGNLIDLYCSKYPRQFSERKDKPFLRELSNIKNKIVRNSDILDFSEFTFVTENAWGVNDLLEVSVTDIKLDKIIEYDGHYIIKMLGNYNTNNLLDKVYCESVEEKYRTKAPKENNAINYSLVKLEN